MPAERAATFGKFDTIGASAALARLADLAWKHKYLASHVLKSMGGQIIRGLDLPACLATSDQLGRELGLAPKTMQNWLSVLARAGVIEKRSGRVEWRTDSSGATYGLFKPGPAKGPRVLVPGLVLRHDHSPPLGQHHSPPLGQH